MPVEHRRFENVDKIFKSNMDIFANCSMIWDAIENDKMNSDFDSCNKMLD